MTEYVPERIIKLNSTNIVDKMDSFCKGNIFEISKGSWKILLEAVLEFLIGFLALKDMIIQYGEFSTWGLFWRLLIVIYFLYNGIKYFKRYIFEITKTRNLQFLVGNLRKNAVQKTIYNVLIDINNGYWEGDIIGRFSDEIKTVRKNINVIVKKKDNVDKTTCIFKDNCVEIVIPEKIFADEIPVFN